MGLTLASYHQVGTKAFAYLVPQSEIAHQKSICMPDTFEPFDRHDNISLVAVMCSEDILLVVDR